MLSLSSQQACDAIRAFGRRLRGGGLLPTGWSLKSRMEEQIHVTLTGERVPGLYRVSRQVAARWEPERQVPLLPSFTQLCGS